MKTYVFLGLTNRKMRLAGTRFRRLLSLADGFGDVYLICGFVLCILGDAASSLPNSRTQLPCREPVKGVHLYTAERGRNESERDVFYAVSTFHTLSCSATFMLKWSIYFNPK